MGKRKIVAFVFIFFIIVGFSIFFSFRSRRSEYPTYTFGDPVTSQEKEQQIAGISEEYDQRVATLPPPIQQQKEQSFSGWKTYRSDVFSFGFQYPPDWDIRDFTASNSDEYVGFYGVGPQSMPEDSIWNISILSLSFHEVIERAKQSANSPNSELVSVTDIRKFGVEGKKISQRNKTTKEVYSTYYVERNGRIYSIPAETTSTDALDQTSRRITDTFIFTK